MCITQQIKSGCLASFAVGLLLIGLQAQAQAGRGEVAGSAIGLGTTGAATALERIKEHPVLTAGTVLVAGYAVQRYYDYRDKCRTYDSFQSVRLAGADTPVVATVPKFDREKMLARAGILKFGSRRWELPMSCHISGSDYGLPACSEPWPGQSEFTKQLLAIEDVIDLRPCPIPHMESAVARHKDVCPVIDCGKEFTHAEYLDARQSVAWPAFFGSHCVTEHNVQPSREFYNYVMAFDQAKLQQVLDKAKATATDSH